MRDRDREAIRKMIKYCDDIETLMGKFGKEYEKYISDIAFQYSCNMCIIQIGELVSRISDETMEMSSQIPWRAIKGMRNLHAHDYDNIDLELVWNTLTEEIPELRKELEELI